MSNPDPYVPSYSFGGYQTSNPTKPLPATKIDNEFFNISSSLNATIAGLADVRRSDGALKNNSVGPDQISPTLSVGFSFRGIWADGESYSAGDGVVYDSVFYRADTAHVADSTNRPDLDPGLWTTLFSVADIAVTGAISMPVDRFTGDGVTKTFALSFTPLSAANVFVKVGGVVQDTTEYSVDGNDLTFVTAPGNGWIVEVRGFATSAAYTVPEDGSVTYTKLDAGVAATIQGAVQKSDTATTGFGFVVDEDDMSSDSDTKVPTQQSVKAYVDGKPVGVLDVADRTALKAVDTGAHTVVYLREGVPALFGRFGMFAWVSSIPIATHQADTQEGIYVAPNAAADGAWVRHFAGSLSPEWFGAVGDGAVTDDQAPMNAALTLAIALGGGSIELQAKRYRMSAPLVGSVPLDVSVTVKGQGTSSSALVFDAGINGLNITIDGSVRNRSGVFAYREFALLTKSIIAATAATFNGVRAQGIPSFMLYCDKVVAKGVTSAQGWLNGFIHTDLNGVRYTFPEFCGEQFNQTGTAFSFDGPNSPTDITLETPRVTFAGTSLNVGGTVEGIMVKTPMFVAVLNGIYHNTPGTEPQLEVRGGHINAHRFGIFSARAAQSNIEGVLIYENPTGDDVGFAGIQVANAADMKIHGCTVHGWNGANTNKYGIVVGTNSKTTTIFGNTLRGHSTINKLDAGIVFDGTQDGTVREYGNVFDDATVVLRVAGGSDTGSRETRTWTQSVVTTLVGGAATETVDIALPAGVFTDRPLDATLTEQAGAQFLVAQFQSQDAATTATNARFLIARADGANIGAGAMRFGVSVRG